MIITYIVWFGSSTISPLRQHDPNTIFGDDTGYFNDFTFSSFNIQDDGDDDAPVTKGKIKAINEKLDYLLYSSKTSSSTEYSLEPVKALIQTFTKEHVDTLQAFTKAVENSNKVVREMTEKVEKLLANATTLWKSFTLCLRTTLLLLISFYFKQGKPHYQTWSLQKISIVNVFGPIETESFLNVHFKAVRGSRNPVFEFTLTELPFLNPSDWISLFSLLLKDAHKFEPILEHWKWMLVSYILEIAKMDVEIIVALKKKPTMQPKETLKDLDKM